MITSSSEFGFQDVQIDFVLMQDAVQNAVAHIPDI